MTATVFLTPNFKLSEFLQSETARAHGIDLSNPPDEILSNLTRVAAKLEQARKIWGDVAVDVHNGWRPLELNRLIGSRDSSAHVQGLAGDVVPEDLDLRAAFNKLLLDGTFMQDVDQAIIERGCIHIGLLVPGRHDAPRREVRIEAWVNGERKYPLLCIWQPPKAAAAGA